MNEGIQEGEATGHLEAPFWQSLEVRGLKVLQLLRTVGHAQKSDGIPVPRYPEGHQTCLPGSCQNQARDQQC